MNPKHSKDSARKDYGCLSVSLARSLNLDFVYDWSNTDMDENTFIRKVLEKCRFTDIVRLAKHFGLERVENLAQEFEGGPNWSRLNEILSRICIAKNNLDSSR